MFYEIYEIGKNTQYFTTGIKTLKEAKKKANFENIVFIRKVYKNYIIRFRRMRNVSQDFNKAEIVNQSTNEEIEREISEITYN